MTQHLRPALVMIAVFTLLTGLAYPLAITAVSQVVFSSAANGSLIVKDGKVIGSTLIGQAFTRDGYFQPRPSATTAADPQDASKTVDAPYNAASSAGSNLGPITQKLLDRVKGDVDKSACRRRQRADPGRCGDRPRRAAWTRISRRRRHCCRSRGWRRRAVSRKTACAGSWQPTSRAGLSGCWANRALTF